MRLNVSANDIKKIKDPNINLNEGDSDLNILSAFNSNPSDSFSYIQNQSNEDETSFQIENKKDNDNKTLDKSKGKINKKDKTPIDISQIRANREKELESAENTNVESKLLSMFIEHNNKETWPDKSNYDCMWCRHSFEGVPWAIPYSITPSGKFKVFGNFCRAECVAGAIFNQFDDDDMWDKYAMLNMIYQKVHNLEGVSVKVALDPIFLKKLGGILTIEEYREISNNPNKNYYIKMPPMVSIIPSVEELQQTSLFNEHTGNNTRDHLNKELMMKANEELKVRRNKPIYDDTNTLDNYFHISKNKT